MQKVEVSHRTIIFTVLFLLGLLVLYKLMGVIIIMFIAFVLMNALNPIVELFEKIKVPRPLAIFFTFVIMVCTIVLILASIIPTLVEQTIYLGSSVSTEISKFQMEQFDTKALTSQVETLTKSVMNIIKIIMGVGSNIITVFTLLVMTFYLLLEKGNLKQYLKLLFADDDREEQAEALISAIEVKLGGWVRGEIMLMVIVGLLSYIGLTLLGIPFALPLALLAGLLELIPNIGPVLASVPAIIAGFLIRPIIGVGVAILYIVVQQLENNLIVPLVMKQSVGLKPIVTLLCLMIGITLGGIGGAILAVPIFITAEVIIRHFYKYNKSRKIPLKLGD